MLTTNIGAYIEQVRKNLATYTISEDWEAVLTYIEMPQVPLYAYGVTILAERENKSRFVALVKRWKPDSVANNVGIFNLACTPMLVSKISISRDLGAQIQQILTTKIAMSGKKPLMLDGLFCQLKNYTTAEIYTWNADEEVNENLLGLAEMLRKIQEEH
jgi:hypothetical protein